MAKKHRKTYKSSSNILGKTKTHQQIKSLECEASLINLKELVEKRKKGEVAEKVQRNCKVCCIGCVSSFFPLQLVYIA